MKVVGFDSLIFFLGIKLPRLLIFGNWTLVLYDQSHGNESRDHLCGRLDSALKARMNKQLAGYFISYLLGYLVQLLDKGGFPKVAQASQP